MIIKKILTVHNAFGSNALGLKFVFVVSLSACLELLLVCFLNNYTADSIAFLLARLINLFIYFLGMKYFVFKTDKNGWKELKKFLLVAGLNIVVMEAVLHAITLRTDQELVMLILFVSIIMFVLNAVVQKFFIFSN